MGSTVEPPKTFHTTITASAAHDVFLSQVSEGASSTRVGEALHASRPPVAARVCRTFSRMPLELPPQVVIGGHAIRLLASARGTTGRRLSPSGDPVSHFVKHLAIKYGFAVGSCDSSLISEPHLLWLYICMLPCFSEVTVRGLMGILWDHR
ncbi:hypothetical protein PVAP13_1NG423338 [Panicum virgatum]|uniref:Uncharacterized protein n=1 Tax=Panicum virgatum TaxID=38727 RepID=A0A8T0X6R9_PANVG|nr:hypothetical protein PVAP13_1NG423338 [Panicum virgatum]